MVDAAPQGSLEEREIELMTLAVVRERLGGAADRADLLEGVKEIVANLVGSEEMAVFDTRGKTHIAISMGSRAAAWLSRGAPAAPESWSNTPRPDGGPMVFLEVGHGGPSAALALFGLLPHKPRLTPFDRELLEVTATLAGEGLERFPSD